MPTIALVLIVAVIAAAAGIGGTQNGTTFR